METMSIQGPHLKMGSIFTPIPKQITHRIASITFRSRRGKRCRRDSPTASNIFCRELTPANTMAVYRMTANSRPRGMSCKMWGRVTKSREGPAPMSSP